MTELVITRLFAAPRALVYRAFTDPDQLAAWFGPAGWSVPRDSVTVEAKVGGAQRFTMVNDADPALRSPVNATFVEVVSDELLVGEEVVNGIPGLPDGTIMRMRLEFHEEGDGTRLVLRQGPYTPDLETGANAGWSSSFDKLDALLSAQA
jgi:uncharacterized protein YndB with AHSA1/START domain